MARLPAVAAVIGLLSAGFHTEAVLHKARHSHANTSTAKEQSLAFSASLAPTGTQSDPTGNADNSTNNDNSNNPFLVGALGEFMRRFNIPENHKSGIFVDLSNDKTVKGQVYREVSGLCPVYGKNIVLYQPENNPLYANDFLRDVPTKEEANKAGHPLPGGFNNNFKLQSGAAFSPMTEAQLFGYTQLKSTTGLGRCAEMSYMTTAQGSEYRYPFVYDADRKLCFSLLIPSQRLWGERYCSVNNVPAGMTWYCFRPERNPTYRNNLVYGSAYMGENPDEWQKKCPTKAVSGAVFGVWVGGQCIDYRKRPDVVVESVNSKGECWALAFNNPDVASDHAESADEKMGGFGYYFPSIVAEQPKSGGEGRNYASYYGDLQECVLSREVPTCFVPYETGTAYTALGAMDEEPLACSPATFPEIKSPCDPQSCMATVTSCVGDKLTKHEVECEPEDGSKCENRGLLIGLSVAGGLMLLALIGGSVYFYMRRPKPPARVDDEGRSDFQQDQASRQRKQHRQSDLAQQAEPSFWGENTDGAEMDPEIDPSTGVLLDQDY